METISKCETQLNIMKSVFMLLLYSALFNCGTIAIVSAIDIFADPLPHFPFGAQQKVSRLQLSLLSNPGLDMSTIFVFKNVCIINSPTLPL